MSEDINKILKIIAVLFAVGLFFEMLYIFTHWPKPPLTDTQRYEQRLSEKYGEDLSKQDDEKEQQAELEIVVPESFSLDISFISQAPLADWSAPFDHACEEATVLMVHYYFSKEAPEPNKTAQDIRDMVDFESKTYNNFEDTSAEETAQIIRDYYGYKAEVKRDISLEDIKKEIVIGNPVILPTAGRLLGNPFFTPPGPEYHMITVKGFDSTGFIVNDPGTKNGADYYYPNDIIEKALCDWHDNQVIYGARTMIVVSH